MLAEAADGPVVLGIGINVSQAADELPPEVDTPATSLLAGAAGVDRPCSSRRSSDDSSSATTPGSARPRVSREAQALGHRRDRVGRRNDDVVLAAGTVPLRASARSRPYLLRSRHQRAAVDGRRRRGRTGRRHGHRRGRRPRSNANRTASRPSRSARRPSARRPGSLARRSNGTVARGLRRGTRVRRRLDVRGERERSVSAAVAVRRTTPCPRDRRTARG